MAFYFYPNTKNLIKLVFYPITGGITMELVKDFCYVVKEGIVCVEVFSITENRWKYVTADYFEKHCKLMK